MYEHLNEHGRRVIALANEAARELKHDEVDPAHLLIALFKMRDTRGEELINRLHLNEAFIRDIVVGILGKGREAHAGHIPFSNHTKIVLMYSAGDAYPLGAPNVAGDEHILLSLLSSSDNIPSLVFLAIQMGRDLRKKRGTVGPALPDLTYESALEVLGSIPHQGAA